MTAYFFEEVHLQKQKIIHHPYSVSTFHPSRLKLYISEELSFERLNYKIVNDEQLLNESVS